MLRDLSGIGAKGGTTLGGVQQPETAGGPGSSVDQASPPLHALDDCLYGGRYLFPRLSYSLGHGAVLVVYQTHQLRDAALIEILRALAVRLGRERVQVLAQPRRSPWRSFPPARR